MERLYPPEEKGHVSFDLGKFFGENHLEMIELDANDIPHNILSENNS